MRKGSKVKVNKVKSKRTCTAIFVVFLKCTLERRLEGFQHSLTPGTPRFTARRIENPEDKENPEDHEIYRSGVGTLLYLTKHSRSDICNPVRELSKTMDAPAPVHLKEMYKVIRHVLSTKGYGLKFELRKDIIKWALKALSDSDFASDKETRKGFLGTSYIFVEFPLSGEVMG